MLLLACVVGVVLCDEPEWSTCSIGAEEPMFKPKIVDLTPLVGERGGDLTFKIDGVNNGGLWWGWEVRVENFEG